MASSIRGKIADISKGKRIHAVIVEVINGRVTASTNGRLYKGLDVIGGPVILGQKVFIDFSSGTPIVHAYSSSSGSSKTTSVRSITTRIVTDQELVDPDQLLEPGNHSHTESQIIDLSYNAKKIHGINIDIPTEDDDQRFLLYDRTTGKFVLSKIRIIHIDTEEAESGRVIGSNGNGGATWFTPEGGSGSGGADILEGQVFS
jgi:hypothetical protein